MAKNSSLLLQSSIQNNSEELKDFIRDLKNWEKDIKAVDENLSSQNKEDSTNSEAAPPIRCKKKLETTSKDSSKSTSCEVKRRKNEAECKKSQKIPAYDYAAWDKFDVDKALASDEEEDLENKQATSEESKKSGGSRGPKLSKKERAAVLKDEGNKLYSSGQLDDAIAKYTQGMALDPTNALLPANRAMAYIKIKKFTAAEADCNKCLKLDGNYVKGYLRRATARMNLDKNDQALKDYQKVLELEPWNKEAKKEVDKHKHVAGIETTLTEGTSNSDNKATAEKKNENVAKTTMSNKTLESKKTNMTERLKFQQNKKDSQINEKQSKINEKPGTKLTIIEVNSKEDQMQEMPTDPNCVVPVDKPPHLRSTKPLKRVPVIDVPTRDSIGKELQVTSKVIANKASTTRKGQAISDQPETSAKVGLSSCEGEAKISASNQVPRTSHQFTTEWSRISKKQAQAVEYLKIIPPAFFSGLDLEADSLMEVISSLKTEAMPAARAAQYLLALSRSPGFSVNIIFLDDAQKKEFHEVISKCEGGLDDRSQIEHIKKSLV